MSGVLTAPRRVVLAPAAIARPRLEALLEVESPLTMVTGPPGAGKTVLLTAFAATHDVAWLSLASRHCDPATLADAIDAALDDGAARTLVLDDLHHVRGPALDVIRQLLVDAGEGLRVVIASRADPDLGLARLRLGGHLLEVRAADLAFTEDEAAAMLRLAGLDLGPSQVERLVERTEGWAAGLRLAAMSAVRAPDPERFLAEFAGDDRAVGDYLSEEVLALQRPEIRDFLLRTCVVDRVCGDLANALTGAHDGGRTLQHLEHEGALIVCLDRRGRWFRYHGLFLELLRARLDEAHPDLRPELHARAGTWLAANGCGREALPHIVAAEPTDALVALLGDRWVELALEAPAPEMVARAARHLGGDVRIRVVAAGTCLEAGQVAHAVSLLEGLGEAPADVLALGQLFQARVRGDAEGARRAAEQPAAPADAGGRAIVLAHLGAVEFAYGDPSAASEALEAGIALAREARSEALLIACLGRAAALEVVAGRLSRAERAAHSALAVSEARLGRCSSGAAWACAALAAVHWLRGEPDQAEARSDLGSAAAHEADDLLAARALRAVRGHLAIARGDVAGGCAALATAGLHAGDAAGILSGWLDALGPRPIDVDQPVGAREVVEAALVRLDGGDPLSALRRVEPLLDPAAAVHPTLRLHCRLVAAVAAQAVGRPTAGFEHLERALEMASVEHCRQPFARAGLALQPLLERHLTLPTAWGPLASELLLSLAGADPAAALTDPLSDRERDVLRLLPTLLRTNEIAGELFVSVNTVKTHVKSIYRKLDVSSRRDAVARSRELRLI
jgi:LuxR family transcriptional regulator, maltose regulon positive regulatory protein